MGTECSRARPLVSRRKLAPREVSGNLSWVNIVKFQTPP